MPWPSRMRGTVRAARRPRCRAHVVALDGAGAHRWRPIAPRARVEVALDAPALRWAGHGYLDTQRGRRAARGRLHATGTGRARRCRDGTAVLYDVAAPRRRPHVAGAALRRTTATCSAIRAAAAGARCRRPRWRIARGDARATAAPRRVVQRTLEDTPFYARSLVRTRAAGASRDRRAREPVARPLPHAAGCRRCCRSGCRGARAPSGGLTSPLRAAVGESRVGKDQSGGPRRDVRRARPPGARAAAFARSQRRAAASGAPTRAARSRNPARRPPPATTR